MGKATPRRACLSRDVREEESSFQEKKHGGWGQEPVQRPWGGNEDPSKTKTKTKNGPM